MEPVEAYAVRPFWLGRGGQIEAELVSENPVFSFGDTYVSLGDGVTVSSVTVQDAYLATLDLTVAPDASLGPRDLRLEVGGRVRQHPGVVEVIEQSLEVTPSSGKMGALVEVILEGTATRWESGYTWASFGEGVEVLALTVQSPTELAATIAVHPDARPGFRDVSVETGTSVVTRTDGFLVDRQVITAAFEPASATRGESVEFVLDGVDTAFDAAMQVQFLDAGGVNADVAVSQQTVIDGAHAFGRLQLSNAARLGTRDVLIRSATGEAILLPDAFTVLDGPPDLSRVAVDIGLDIFREIDNATGETYQNVQAFAMFYIPLDPACGAPMSMADSPRPYDTNGVFADPPPSEPVDCPFPRTLSAGDVVWFESDENVIPMRKIVQPSTGKIYYLGANLTTDDYRFGTWYDLHTQGDPAEIPETRVERVQPTVPADYTLLTPTFSGDLRQLRTQPFTYTWTPARTYPDAFFMSRLRGTLSDGVTSGYAGSIPWDDGTHTYSPGELLQLSPGYVSFVALSWIEGPYFGLPFSMIQDNQSSSAVQTTAVMVLE